MGLLGSDVIAFQAYSYAKHVRVKHLSPPPPFLLTAPSLQFMSACTRILGLTVQDGSVELDGAVVRIDVLPLSIEPSEYEAALQTEVRVYTNSRSVSAA